MTDTINNQIPFVPENTIDPAAGLNLSLNTIDALLQVLVQTVGANSPPGSPVNGARYIVGTSPTGAWVGQANKLARYLDTAWGFHDARYVLNAADDLWYVRSASTWAALAGGAGETNTASNLGAGEGLYAAKVGVDLRFKSLVEGSGVTISSDADTVTISTSDGGGSSAGPISRNVSADTAVITPDDAGALVSSTGTDPAVFTIDNDATEAWDFPDIFPTVSFIQTGAGPLTIAGDGFSILLHSEDTAVLNGPGAVATAVRLGPDVWRLFGDLVPV